ncbi:hypothetical protein HQ447_16320 [bacterium]|nr:hypothetical protein [bacterium]
MKSKLTPATKKAVVRRPTGRPSKRTPEVVARIITALSDGIPLAAVCREPGMPHPDKVREWQRGDEILSADIARARLEGFDAIAYRLRTTARGTGESTKDVQRDKLIIDTDLKLLAKWDPKRYGERIDVNANHSGEIKIVVGGDAS